MALYVKSDFPYELEVESLKVAHEGERPSALSLATGPQANSDKFDVTQKAML